jgi:hypothetical protein
MKTVGRGGLIQESQGIIENTWLRNRFKTLPDSEGFGIISHAILVPY